MAAPVFISCALVLMITFGLWAIKVHAPDRSHLIFFYLLPITGLAFIFGSFTGLVAGAFATLVGTYFLYDPMYTFYFSRSHDLGEVGWFVLLSVLGTKCVSEIRRS